MATKSSDGPATDDTVAATSVSGPSTDPTLPAPASDPNATALSRGPAPDDATLLASVAPGAGPADDLGPLVTVERSNYTIDRAFARGGMGRISTARDRRLGRTVAIKELLVHDDGLVRRFEREARITARLQHPGIVPLHEAGRWPSGEPFYAMKLVLGRSLDQVIDATPTLAARLGLLPNVIAVVDALAYAHGERVIHRDLKPSNVLVGAFGETVVIDWGLAKEIDDPDPVSFGPYRKATSSDAETVGVLGTPAYMPPEQAAGERLDTRADVYALGALLYHVLAGAPPYRAQTVEELLDQVLAGPPVPLATRIPDAPPELVAIVERAMKRDPDARFPTAREMAEELKRFQTGKLVESHHYSAWDVIRHWLRRHRGIAITVAVAAIIAISGAGVFLWRERTLRRQEAAARRTAERTLAWAMVERGREELTAHHPARAATLLAAAYPDRPDDPILRMLLARALRDTARSLLAIPHAERILAAAFSPDGQQVLTSSADGLARIWDARTGALAITLATTAPVDNAVFNRAGTRIVTVPLLRDSAVTVWDARTGAAIATLRGHEGRPHLARFNADASRVVTASSDHTARVWDAQTGALLATLAGHRGTIVDVNFDASGTHVVTASADDTAKLWNAATGALEAALVGHTDEVISAAFSADAAHVVTASWDGTVKIWDTGTALLGTTITGHTGHIARCVLRADGNYIATTSGGTVKLWDGHTGALVASLAKHGERVTALEFASDGRLLAASSDGTVRIWDVPSGKLLATLDGHSRSVSTAAFSPDGTRVVTGGDDRIARIWDASAGPGELVGRGTDWVQAVSYSADGTRVAAAGFDHTITLWDPRTGSLLATLDGHAGPVNTVSFGASDSRLVSASSDGTAKLWNAHTRLPIMTFTHRDDVQSASLSADQAWVATASDDRTATIWNARTGAAVVTLTGHTDALLSVAFDPAATHVVTAGFDRTARLWDARTGARIYTLEHGGAIRSARFSSDGQRIVTAGGDATAKLWEAISGSLLATLAGHDQGVQDAVFSGDGLLVATAGNDGTVRIWEARTAAPLAIFEGHTGAVRAVAFAPDHSQVASGGTDGTVRIWDLRPELRSPAEVARIVADKSAWKVLDLVLVPR